MKIPFSRVAKGSIYPLQVESDKFSVEAEFSFQPKNSTMLLGHLRMRGELRSICNSCGDDVVEKVDEELDFLVNDGVFNGFDDEFDVIEALDSSIDLEEILLSELELIASSYFHCGKCSSEDEREF